MRRYFFIYMPEYTICNKKIIFSKSRIISKLENEVKVKKIFKTPQFSRVVNSLKLPNKKLTRLYWNYFNAKEIACLSGYFYSYYLSLKKIYQRDSSLVFIGVARSGVPLLNIIKFLFEKDGIKIKCIIFSPNYYNLNNINKLKKFVSNSETLVFVDGWISSGLTYEIIKNICKKYFSGKKFIFSVIVNMSSYLNKDILFVTNKDLLLPWSVFQTDHAGYSNFFLHNNQCTCFYLPPNKRIKVLDPEDYFINRQKKKVSSEMVIKLKSIKASFKSNIKYGVNEVFKSIDKNDAISVNIPASSRYKNFLIKYGKYSNIPYKVDYKSSYCFSVRKEIKR